VPSLHHCSGDIMILPKRLLTGPALLALALSSNPSSAIPVEAGSVQTSSLAGVWTGSLLQKEWTFEFKAEGGDWSGRYMPPGGVKWHALTAVRVSKGAVAFSMDSKPKLSFELGLDAAKAVMSGSVVIEGVATVPFLATRKT
jgi:hypothetical protein